MFPPTFFRRAVFLAVLGLAARASAQGTLYTLVESGPRSERVNIVVFSEGYTAGQLDTQFRKDAAGLVESILATPPYSTYRNHFNAYAIAVASNQSGADYPNGGVVRDTYFNASFGSGTLDRLLTIDATGLSRVNTLTAALLPESDIPLVLVNDPRYGGAGGPVAVASVEVNAAEVVVHEIGHSFADLADEYDIPGSPTRESPNSTRTKDRALIRWRHWIDPLTPLPTPENDDWREVTGLFEGAASATTGWFRPTLDSMMNHSGQPLREVNEETIALSILELIPRVHSVSPPAGTVNSMDGKPLTFRVNALRPGGIESDPLTWYVDGVPAAGEVMRRRLISRGSAWKYLASGTAPSASWRTAAFNDSAWPSGAAPLGFGDASMATTVPGGPTNSRYPTIYFRRVFSVADPAAMRRLRLELRRDDGAVVHLNGTEIYRSNMATGNVVRSTLAASTEGDEAAGYWWDHVFPSSGLVAGDNLLAVEVHQSSTSSPDLRFDLALIGDTQAMAPQAFISSGDTWKYLDKGVFPGSTWKGLNFDDSAWASGPTELGYGDGDEAKVIGFGPSASNKYITTWFRRKFTVARPADFTALNLRLKRDDGAAVYLNSTEIARTNVGEVTVDPAQLAAVALDDGKRWLEFNKGTDALRVGDNVVAVEVHQSAVNSPDLSFNLELSGRRTPLPTPLVPAGEAWRYWDRGEPPQGWKEVEHDDVTWSFGRAELGYGDGNEYTTIGFGGNPANRHPAAYFRHTFFPPAVDPARSLWLRAKFDDGAVIYVNGVEVARPNMGWGAISHASLAGRPAPDDGSGFTDFEISASLLRSGANVIAAEVHQFSVSDDDLSFDLELSQAPSGAFMLDPTTLPEGEHLVEARYDDPSGKILQDPADHTTATVQWRVNVTPSVDSDGDGLPDPWETAMLGNTAGGAADDPDGDGQSNAEEYAAGTHPAQAVSVFRVTSAPTLSGGILRLEWFSVPGKTYQVETAADPASPTWSALQTVPGAEAPATVTAVDISAPSNGQPRAFYRVRVTDP